MARRAAKQLPAGKSNDLLLGTDAEPRGRGFGLSSRPNRRRALAECRQSDLRGANAGAQQSIRSPVANRDGLTLSYETGRTFPNPGC
jgi:hypothetical protein